MRRIFRCACRTQSTRQHRYNIADGFRHWIVRVPTDIPTAATETVGARPSPHRTEGGLWFRSSAEQSESRSDIVRLRDIGVRLLIWWRGTDFASNTHR